MSNIDVNSLLAEMRTLAAEAQGVGAIGPADDVAPPKTSFSELLAGSVDSVNDTQSRAKELARAFETGNENVDLAEVMISLQKASLSFQAMTEVRNKLVSAYQEIMNMPV